MHWKQCINQKIINSWYNYTRWSLWLKPFSALFYGISQIRRIYWQKKHKWQPPVPVVIVGNITVGGTGKTPVLLALIEHFKTKHFNIGVASRGYKSTCNHTPTLVKPSSCATIVGDEPLLLAQLQVPVVIAKKRVDAVKKLIDQHQCNLIFTDDGLQHYQLNRHIEIAVLDGKRLLGNGLCLPAGPLREPEKRLNEVDYIIIKESPSKHLAYPYQSFSLKAQPLIPISKNYQQPPKKGFTVHAVAGIANPDNFFSLLKKLGFKLLPHIFNDHHQYQEKDLQFNDNIPIIMTAKDAVKCKEFNIPQLWYLPIKAQLPDNFLFSLEKKILNIKL